MLGDTMEVSNRNFSQVMEGAERRIQLHYKVFGVELGWLSTPCLVVIMEQTPIAVGALLCPGP